MRSPHRFGLLVAAMTTTSVGAQSFNMNFSPFEEPLPDSYGAAGQTGHWICIPGTHGVTVPSLVDVNGVATNVSFLQIGGFQTLWAPNLDMEGSDAALMDGYLVSFDAVLESCLFFNDLEPGTYEVLIYARTPNEPDLVSYTNCDEEPGNPHFIVGGEWTGEHEELVTYSRHMAEVAADGPNAGLLRAHSGVAPGEDPADGAALNAIQVRRIEEIVGDTNGDGQVNVTDLLAVLAAWGPCAGCVEDFDDDTIVGITDLLVLLSNWTG